MRKLNTQRRTAAAACEMAIVFPAVLLIVLSFVDLGRISYAYLAVSNAARAGAEQGATQRFNDYTRPDWEQDIHDAVLDEMQSLADFDPALLTVDIDTNQNAYGETRVVVAVSYPFQQSLGWLSTFTTQPMQRSVQMLQIR